MLLARLVICVYRDARPVHGQNMDRAVDQPFTLELAGAGRQSDGFGNGDWIDGVVMAPGTGFRS